MTPKNLSLERKFKQLMHAKNLTVREFCKEIGMSTTNLYVVFRRNTIDTKYLQNIEDRYDVPPCYFLSENDNMSSSYYASNEKEILLIKELQNKVDSYIKEVEAKEKEIILLRQLVESKDMLIANMKGA